MTLMRRLLWTRPNVSISGFMAVPSRVKHPAIASVVLTFPGWTHSVAAVGPVLFLPDRHEFLEPVDGVAARLERLGAVRTADGHGDADLADVEAAEAMDQHHLADRPALARVALRSRPSSSRPCRDTPRSRARR